MELRRPTHPPLFEAVPASVTCTAKSEESTAIPHHRDRCIISICGAASTAIDEEVKDHLRAALTVGDITRRELEELVIHFAVYAGWNLGQLRLAATSSVEAADRHRMSAVTGERRRGSLL